MSALRIAIASLTLASSFGLAHANTLSELASEKLSFARIPALVAARGGWSSPPNSGAIRFALPDARGFVWSGLAMRAKGAPESAPAARIELLAPESGASAGAAFPVLVDESSLAFDSPSPAQFSSLAFCHDGSLESQVGATITAPGKRALNLRSAYTPRSVLIASIGQGNYQGPPAAGAFLRATDSIEALRKSAAASSSIEKAQPYLEKLKSQSERSQSSESPSCPTLSFGQAWPATIDAGIDASTLAKRSAEPDFLRGFLGIPAWRAEVDEQIAGPIARLELLGKATDTQALDAEAASRALMGAPQRARMGYEAGAPDFALTWQLPNGAKASLKYQRAANDESGSLLYEIDKSPAR